MDGKHLQYFFNEVIEKVDEGNIVNVIYMDIHISENGITATIT